MMTIHFIRPFSFIALIPAVMYLVWVIYSTKPMNPWLKICDSHLLPNLLKVNQTHSPLIYHLILFSLYFLTIFAIAGPSWQKVKLPVYREVSSIMIVLDVSPAMLLHDLSPDRLTRAKFKIRDLINQSKMETEMGLVVFSGEAFTASPISEDANTLTAILKELHPNMMPLSGSEMGEGLWQAFSLMKQTRLARHRLLLITGSEPTASSWEAAKAILLSGNQLNILATVADSKNNEHTISALQQLAKMGGGDFYLFQANNSDIASILNDAHTKRIIQDPKMDHATLWQDTGPWFCLLLLPLFLWVLREKCG